MKNLCLLLATCLCLAAPGKLLALEGSDLVTYYNILNDAEINICKGNLEQSYNLYGKAYKIRGNDMATKHLYNYFILCADLQKWKDCKVLLTEIRKRDSWDYESYKKIIDQFGKSSAGKINDMYLDLNRIETSTDKAYTAVLDSLHDIDQKVNTGFRAANNGLLEGADADSFHRLTANNIEFIYSLLSKKFPTDKTLPRREPYSSVRYGIILRHNVQFGNSHAVDRLFYDAVLRSDFRPEEFAYWVSDHYKEAGRDSMLTFGETQVHVPLFPYDLVVYKDSLFEFPLTDTGKIVLCNQNRKKIPGLCSVEEQRIKIIYQYYHPDKYQFVFHEEFEIDLPPHVVRKLDYIGRDWLDWRFSNPSVLRRTQSDLKQLPAQTGKSGTF